MIIRPEQPDDTDKIRDINCKAFGQLQEANIIDDLRKHCEGILSLVAVEKEKIIGHILFSPVTIESGNNILKGMGLAPMAVSPDFQRQGIGSHLVNRGIEELKKNNCPFIVVLGHPEYYPRFGFEPASKYGIKSQWEGIPDNVFMILWLDKSMVNKTSGIAKYGSEFNEAMNEKKKLTAPCGLDCFNCEIFEDNLTDRVAESVHAKMGVPKEEIACKGCRRQDGKHFHLSSGGCPTLNCVKKKGVEFCCDCGDFPCSLLAPVAESADRYPHNMKVYNLCRIKKIGIDRWVEEEAGHIRKRYFTGKFVVGRGQAD